MGDIYHVIVSCSVQLYFYHVHEYFPNVQGYFRNVQRYQAILKFQMVAFTKLANRINTALNVFLDPGQISLDTKMMSVRASHSALGTQYDLIGGHIELQDGCRYQLSQY
jgi:hypothetical protein